MKRVEKYELGQKYWSNALHIPRESRFKVSKAAGQNLTLHIRRKDSTSTGSGYENITKTRLNGRIILHRPRNNIEDEWGVHQLSVT